MSMPQPIHVALIGSSADVVRQAKEHFRLSAPGIGAAYMVCVDANSGDMIVRLDNVPKGLIHLWVALDKEALSAAQARHQSDAQQPSYNRGFYDNSLPDPCVLVDYEHSPSVAKTQLAKLARKVIEAWYDSS